MQRDRGGFSLIEIIIVIGLIALISGLILTTAGGILRGIGERPAAETLALAVREARFQAASTKETTVLDFDSERMSFVIESDTGEVLGTFSTGYDEGNLQVQFFQILPARGTSPTSMPRIAPLDRPRFRPDRSATPFEAELRVYDETSRHRFDPFSDIELSRND